MPDLFSARGDAARRESAPLADRLRPESFDDFVGQEEIVGEGTLLRRAIQEDRLVSMIFWGPPGTGKTTLARIIANRTGRRFVSMSAVLSGVKDLRAVIAGAEEALKFETRRTVLFIDEIHRFNKAQQDALLPAVESGTLTLIGATTENPSFEVISALLSRCRVFILKAIEPEGIERIVRRALKSDSGLAPLKIEMDDDAANFLAQACGGDARAALNVLELAAQNAQIDSEGRRRLDSGAIQEAVQKQALLYDKGGEEHFNLISALHKSLRGSDPQGALYWLTRMLEAGEDPMYIARRLVRFASEDIGLADPQALTQALAAKDAVHFIGRPEGDLALAQAAVYMAAAPKSNRLYRAQSAARKDAAEHLHLPVPLHLRNAPTRFMKEIGYGRDYQYDHNAEGNVAAQDYLPDEIKGAEYYKPGTLGFEKEMAKRMAYWERLRAESRRHKREADGSGESPAR